MLIALGVDHHQVESTELERWSADTSALRLALADQVAGEDSPLAGTVLLSTCNRIEIYAEAIRFHDAVEAVTDAVAVATGADATRAESVLQVRVGTPVAAHLFAVAAGLDAMVVGEAEISGQVAAAHRQAQDDDTLTPQLHNLFRSAARTAKQVASSTRLGAEGRSIASVALDLAQQRLGADDLTGRRVLIIGTGAYARVVAAAVRDRGATDLSVYSASGRAAIFAKTHAATEIAAQTLPAAFAAADLVVATSGRRPDLDLPALASVLAVRATSLVALDLALPHDLPDELRSHPALAVIDLHSVAQSAGPAHRAELTAAEQIVIDAVSDFEDDLAGRTIDPAVVALRSHVGSAVEVEVDRLRRKYSGAVADDLERAIRRVAGSLLHTPTIRAKELAKDGSGADYIQALHTVFGIELPN